MYHNGILYHFSFTQKAVEMENRKKHPTFFRYLHYTFYYMSSERIQDANRYRVAWELVQKLLMNYPTVGREFELNAGRIDGVYIENGYHRHTEFVLG